MLTNCIHLKLMCIFLEFLAMGTESPLIKKNNKGYLLRLSLYFLEFFLAKMRIGYGF